MRKDNFIGTTPRNDGDKNEPTDQKKCAVILLSRLLFTMRDPLLFTMCNLFGLRNEVPDGSVSDQGRQKQVFIGQNI